MIWTPVCNKPLVAHPSLTWCLERKIPVGRRPFSQAGRRRSSFSGDEEQSPPPYPTQGPNRPRPRTHLHQTHKSGNVTLMTKKTHHQQQNNKPPAWHRALWGLRLFLTGDSALSLAHRASLWTWMLLMLHVLLSTSLCFCTCPLWSFSSCHGRPVCRGIHICHD